MPTIPNRICRICSKPFYARIQHINKGWGLYCSLICKGKAQKQALPMNAECRQCKSPIHITPSDQRRGRGHYCSAACFGLACRKEIESVCASTACRKTFIIEPWQERAGQGRYCSRQSYIDTIFMPEVIEKRFWRSVDFITTPRGCWPWIPTQEREIYGNFSVGRKSIPSHVFSYELTHGPILLPGVFICHLCNYKPCCNPKHLYAGNAQLNSQQALHDGLYLSGENHPQARLNNEDIYEIRNLKGLMTEREIAEFFNIGNSTVHHILSRETWKHL